MKKRLSRRGRKEQEVDLKVFTEEKKCGRINCVKPGLARNIILTRHDSCFHEAYWVEETKGVKAAIQPNFTKCRDFQRQSSLRLPGKCCREDMT